MIDIQNISHNYGSKITLQNYSLKIPTGKIICLGGPSGSGKSTLLRIIAGLEKPTQGIVTLSGGVAVSSKIFVPPEQRNVGMVFQDYALFPHLTALQNVTFALWRMPRAQALQRARELLAEVQLDAFHQSYPHELSGGQQQRVALVRALAPRPQCVLLDEPFSGLDPELKQRIRSQTFLALRKQGTTALLVSHDEGDSGDADGFVQLILPKSRSK